MDILSLVVHRGGIYICLICFCCLKVLTENRYRGWKDWGEWDCTFFLQVGCKGTKRVMVFYGYPPDVHIVI